MKENLAYKISSSFSLLGLKPGADERQIRSAFRRLARTHHPDIAGVLSAKKYEQISSAYILLKNLTPEELSLCETQKGSRGDKRESFFASWKRRHAEKEAAREEELRAAREAKEAAAAERERAIYNRVSLILDKCAREINSARKKKNNEKLSREISDIVVRLLASREEVRLMAIQNISEYFNVPQVVEALLNMLNKYPMTGNVLLHINKLQFPHEIMRKIISIVSNNAGNIEEQEVLTFIKRIIYMIADDKSIISKFMEHPSLKITEFLIARWTFTTLPNEVALKKIFSDIHNEKLIISTLNMLKRQDARTFPSWLALKISELFTHDNTSVRLWARAVSSNENMVK